MPKKQLVKKEGELTITEKTSTNKPVSLSKKSSADFNRGVKVTSEINKLREVIVHRPGIEVERVLDNPHFGNAMFLDRVRKEHNLFVNILRHQGVKVHYLEDLLLTALNVADPSVVQEFIKQYLIESGIKSISTFETCFNFLKSLDSNAEVIKVMFGGIKVSDVPQIKPLRFSDIHISDSPFLIEPLPFLMYQRKFINAIGTGLAFFVTSDPQLKRHSLVYEYILRFHPRFVGVKLYTNREFKNCLIASEDVLQITSEILLIGITNNTDVIGVESLARNLLNDQWNPIKRVIALNLTKFGKKASLNKLISMMDSDKFIIAREVLEINEIFELIPTKQRDVDGIIQISFQQLAFTFAEVIEAVIDKQPRFVIIGGGDSVAERKELKDSGINVLTLTPGEIIVYDRNSYTNNLLNELGLIIHKIPSSELSHGPSGPFDMVWSLWRE